MPRLCLLAFVLAHTTFAVATAEVDFVRDVRPLFREHCYECHGAEKQMSGLRLDINTEVIKPGDDWTVVVPGQPNQSPLVDRIISEDEDERMPPEGPPLSPQQIATIKLWIKDGAIWPDGANDARREDRRNHWSFQRPEKSTQSQTIDAFIDARLSADNLTRNPPADPRTLVRRIYLDLTGLPPTPSEVAAFVEHPHVEPLVDRVLASPHYGERWAQHWLDVIRWAETVGFETNAERRDAWHYRDWVIAALNDDMPYDQFIFEQLAGDTTGADAAMGFLVAGPANLPGQVGRDEAAMRSARQDELDEVIRTFSQAILGLTVECARCHDHKFDPISQADYYAMQAIFSGLHYGTRRLRGPLDDRWTAELPSAEQRVAQLSSQLEALRQEFQLKAPLDNVHHEPLTPVLARSIRMRIEATTNHGPASLYEFEVWGKSVSQERQERRNVALASRGAEIDASSFALANQSRHFDNLIDGSIDKRQAYPWVAARGGPAWFQIDLPSPAMIDGITLHIGASMPADFVVEVLTPNSDRWTQVMDTHDRLPRHDDHRSADKVKLGSLDHSQVQRIVTLLSELRTAQSERNRLAAGPQVYAARFDADPEPTYLLHRGDPMQRRQRVEAAVPAFLGELATSRTASEAHRRVALAQWLTRDDHPLTARVMVNRIWQHHFGTGLVDTPSDFGRMGRTPSHPELLDWLAQEFISSGWSIKQLHRKILTSATYCQSSVPRLQATQIDAGSRLLWRFPPRRLEAEAIRDAILHVSGKLNFEAGGRGFDLFNQRGGLSDYVAKKTFDESGWRRMIYAHKVRMISVDVFGAFDCPDAGQMTPERTRSITPLQSLALLNSSFVNRQAAFFAERVRAEAGDDLASQVDRVFALAYSRRPTAPESRHLIELAKHYGLEQVCRTVFNTSEFLSVR